MPVSRGVMSALIAGAGVVFLLLAIVVVASVLGSNAPVRPIIAESLQLRNATDPLQKAKLISDIDDMVAQTRNNDVKDQWDRMTACLGTKCPDAAYLDMVLVMVSSYEKELPESDLLINVVAVGKYWNDPEHLLEFSKAMSLANDQIDGIKNKNAHKEWQAVLDCKGTCANKNDLLFDLIRTIVQ